MPPNNPNTAKTTLAVKNATPVAEVEPPEVEFHEEAPAEVVVAPRPLGVAPRPLFQTTTSDAPTTSVPQVLRLNPKTEAEQAAGRLATAQYRPAE